MRLLTYKDGTPGFCCSVGLFRYDKAGKKFLQKFALSPNPITKGPFAAQVVLGSNYSFAVLNNGTLQEVELNTGVEKNIRLSDHLDIAKGVSIKAVYNGKGNKIWLTTNTPKFYSYHPDTGVLEAFEAKGEENSTGNNYFIFEDDNGIVWISIAGSGLVKAEPVREIFELQRPSESKIANVSDNIRGITEWTKDSVLVNTINGVLLLNRNTRQFKNVSYPDMSFSGSAYSKIIVDRDTNLWIAGWQRQGLFYVNRNTGRVIKFFPLSDPQNKSTASVRTMLIDSKGFLWLGTSDNTILRTKVSEIDFTNPGKTVFESFNSTVLNNEKLIFNITFDIIENSRQEIYFGTQSGVYIYNYNNKKLSPLKFNSSNNPISDVRAFCFDRSSILWMGTNGSGLYAFNELTKELKTYTTKNGLPDNSVYTILSDSKNNLWLGTNKGLCRFNPFEKNVRNFSLKDGIQNYEYNTNAACKLSTGELAFGGINGLNIFYPDSILSFSEMPQVVITQFMVQEIQKPVIGPLIHLTADENYLSFQFAALNYVRNEENQYAYKLEGLDKDWIYCDKRRFTNYANLSPGKYTLRVKCCNANGVWNTKGTAINFFIATPWYSTWWFRGLLILTLLAGIYGWYRYRLYQTLRFQAVRDRIGRDLHDEIGSTLQSISFYSEVAGKIVEEKAPEAKSMLAQISESTTNMMEAMSDIVWAINTRNDSFANIINRMRAFAVEVLEAKNCNLHFDISESLQQYNLEMEERKNLYLIFKETINNAAKHSGCKNVTVHFHPKGDQLNLIIEDDGKGFVQKEDFRGNGLFNIRKRASELKGTINITSEPGKGTKIDLSFAP